MALLVALVAGCGGTDDGDATADAEPTTTAAGGTDVEGASGSSLSTTSTTSTTTTTGPTTTTLPEGAVVVPIDEDLRARLPLLEGGGRQVDADETFDERFCDGTKAPTVPKSQARATYPLSPTDELTIAAYRFSAGGGASYLADYATAVRSCAVEAGENMGLGVPELFGSAFELTTERGEAFMVLALDDDVLWVLFQESTAGPVEVDQSTYDAFIGTVLG